MKRFIFITLALIISTVGLYANNYIYCELVGTSKLLSNKVKVQVDYGQETSFWKGISYLKDENGKNIEFNSMVDAMNYFGKQGWEFVQAYVITNGNQNVCHWLLKKDVTGEDMDKALESDEHKK